MASLPHPRTRSVSWTTPISSEEVLSRVALLANDERRGEILSQSESSIELYLGSRASYRIWGILTPARLLPIRLTVTVSPGNGDVRHVSAQLVSDYGWAAFEFTRWVSYSYNKAFDYVVRSLDRELNRP
jgi:hypothetical protein